MFKSLIDLDEKTVKDKVNKHAFSGGRTTLEEHRKLGGDPDIDVSFQWLTFLEPDDEKVSKIYHEYKSGKLLTGELKKILIDQLTAFLKEHQQKRKEAADRIGEFIPSLAGQSLKNAKPKKH